MFSRRIRAHHALCRRIQVPHSEDDRAWPGRYHLLLRRPIALHQLDGVCGFRRDGRDGLSAVGRAHLR